MIWMDVFPPFMQPKPLVGLFSNHLFGYVGLGLNVSADVFVWIVGFLHRNRRIDFDSVVFIVVAHDKGGNYRGVHAAGKHGGGGGVPGRLAEKVDDDAIVAGCILIDQKADGFAPFEGGYKMLQSPLFFDKAHIELPSVFSEDFVHYLGVEWSSHDRDGTVFRSIGQRQ